MTDHPSALVSVPVDLIGRALEELRMIRMKDSDAVYDTTIRLELQLALAAAPAAPQAAGVGELVADLNVLATCDDMEVSHSGGDTNVGDVARRCLIHLRAPSRGEGGAVWPEVTDAWADTYCALTGRDPDGQQVTFVDGGVATTFRNVAKREIEAMLCAAPKSAVAALATREEAPAEVGEPVETVSGPLYDLIHFLRPEFREETKQHLARRTSGLLRAQPPAREDAQPVAWLYETVGGFHTASVEVLTHIDGHKVFGRPLYTRPDRDALRTAEKALEAAKSDILDLIRARSSEAEGTEDQWVGHIDQALAALQAEQGAK